jgi:putative transposase
VIRMVAHPKLSPDHGRHPLPGPDVATKPECLGPTRQQHRQLRPLLDRQFRGRARRDTPLQRFDPALSTAAHPLADRPGRHTQRLRNLLLAPALRLQRPRPQSTPLTPILWPASLLVHPSHRRTDQATFSFPREDQYVWLDATFVKVRDGGRVVSMAVVVAIGVRSSGEREVLGLDVGPSEDGAFWHQFLRSLVARGLGGVQLVISDAHQGLKSSIAAVLQGASWQRCRVHFVRNALGLVPKAAAEMVAATIRTVFAQPDPTMAREQWRKVADGFRTRYPRLAVLLDDAEADVLAYLAFPREHWRQIWSNNPLERLNKEIKRRTDVVGIFPNDPAVIRLVGAVLAEQHDEWQVGRRYFSAESLAKLRQEAPTDTTPALVAAS